MSGVDGDPSAKDQASDQVGSGVGADRALGAAAEQVLLLHLARAGEHLRGDRLADAAAEIDAALGIGPGDVRARNLLGLLHFRAGRFSEAEAVYLDLLSERADDMSLRLNLGLVEMRLGRPRQAVEHLSLVVDAEPDNKRAQSYYGLALMRAGELQEARSVLVSAGQDDLVRQVDQLLAQAKAKRPTEPGLHVVPPAQPTATKTRHSPPPIPPQAAQSPKRPTLPPLGNPTEPPVERPARTGASSADTPLPPPAPVFGASPPPAPVPQDPLRSASPLPGPAPEAPAPVLTPEKTPFTRWPATQAEAGPPSFSSLPSLPPLPPVPTASGQTDHTLPWPAPGMEAETGVPGEISEGRLTATYRGRVARPISGEGEPLAPAPVLAEARRAVAAGAKALEGEQPFVPAESVGEARSNPADWQVHGGAQGLPQPAPSARTPQRPIPLPQERSLPPPTSASAMAALSLSNFVREREVTPPSEGSFSMTQEGLLLIRVTGSLPTRSVGVIVSTGELAFVPLTRRARGRQSEEPFGDGQAGLFRATGSGVMVISPRGGHFAPLTLIEDSIYLRESATFAFEDTLHWENGRIPGAGPAPGYPGLPDHLGRVVQFRGSGQVVIHTLRRLFTVRLLPAQSSYIEVEQLVGWTGRIIPTLLSEGGVPTPYVECSGEGFLLIEPPTAESFAGVA